MANFNDITIDKEYPKVIKKLLQRGKILERENFLLEQAIRLVVDLPDDELEADKTFSKFANLFVKANALSLKKDNTKIDAEELEKFLKSKTNV